MGEDRVRILTDPVRIEHLPKLDAIIVSNDHYDHLEGFGVPPERITELDWWEEATSPRFEVSITAAPSQHFSGRGLERNATLWSSFAMRGPKHKVG